jgi:nucleoside-diphosphate-sugar epimerase
MKISVLGCGWLGFPLAQQLLRLKHSVKGSTTTKNKLSILQQAGIESYQINLPNDLENSEVDTFWDSDILFLNIPPSRKNKDVIDLYPNLIKQIKSKVEDSPIEWVIFASSTSVYSNKNGLFSEQDALFGETSRDTGEAVLRAEYILMENASFHTTILRFGGLYGYNRHPIRYLAGKKDLKEPTKPVNLIHQDDCINIVKAVIEQGKKDEIYNAVSDGHPPRRTFYKSAAKHFDLKPPKFLNGKASNGERIISNKKLKKHLNYKFIYPNPLDHTA